jgi:hypothetical protein
MVRAESWGACLRGVLSRGHCDVFGCMYDTCDVLLLKHVKLERSKKGRGFIHKLNQQKRGVKLDPTFEVLRLSSSDDVMCPPPAPCLAACGILCKKKVHLVSVSSGVLVGGQPSHRARLFARRMRDADPKIRRCGPAVIRLMRLGRLEGRSSHKCGPP